MKSNAGPVDIASNYLRLRPDDSVEVMPEDDTFWPRLMQGELGLFTNEYLVTQLDFTEDWQTREVHPKGDEIVFPLSGAAEFILESPEGETTSMTLNKPCQYVFVARECWHTAKVPEAASMLFITAGKDTQNRPL